MLEEVVDLITEKELRLRTPLEELDLLMASRRAGKETLGLMLDKVAYDKSAETEITRVTFDTEPDSENTIN